MRLIELGVLLSKDSEDCLGGITGLKPGKEGMVDEVLLSLAVVFFQGKVEYGSKVGIGCRHGRGGGHGVTVRGEERERDSW
jgi:hypothetical protein